MISEMPTQAFWSDKERSHKSSKDLDFCEILQDDSFLGNETLHLVKKEITQSSCLVKNIHNPKIDSINFQITPQMQQIWTEDTFELARCSVQPMPNLVQSFYDFFITPGYTEDITSPSCRGKGPRVQYWTNIVYDCSRFPIDCTHCKVNPYQTKCTYSKALTVSTFLFGLPKSHNYTQNSTKYSCDIPTNASRTRQETWTFSKLVLAVILLASFSMPADAINSEHAVHKPCQVLTTSSNLVYERHPDNCSVFYICYGTTSWKMTCKKQETVFSINHKVCVWKNSVFDDCQGNTKLQTTSLPEKDDKTTTSPQKSNHYFKFLDEPNTTYVEEDHHKIYQHAPEVKKTQKQVTDLPETFIDTNHKRHNNNQNYLHTQVMDDSLILRNEDFSKSNFPTHGHSDTDYNSSKRESNTQIPRNHIAKPNVQQPGRVDTRMVLNDFYHKEQAEQDNMVPNYNYNDNNNIKSNNGLKNNYQKSGFVYNNNNIQMTSDNDWPIERKDIRAGSDQDYDQLGSVTQPFFQKEILVKATYVPYNNYLERTTYASISVEYAETTKQYNTFDDENDNDFKEREDGHSSHESINTVDSPEVDEADVPIDRDDDDDARKKNAVITEYDISEEADSQEINMDSTSLTDVHEDFDPETQEDTLRSSKFPVVDEVKYPFQLNQNHDLAPEIEDPLSATTEIDDRSPDEISNGPVFVDSFPHHKSWLQGLQPTEITYKKDRPVDVQDIFEGIQTQETRNSPNKIFRSLERNAETQQFESTFVPRSREDFSKRITNGFDLRRHDKIAHNFVQNNQDSEFEENSFQRNERKNAFPHTLSTHKINKNRQTIPTQQNKSSKENTMWYINNREKYTTKERFNTRKFVNNAITKPPHKMAQENIIIVQPWPELKKKLSQTLTKGKLSKQSNTRTSDEEKANNNPHLMHTFLRFLNLTDNQKDTAITRKEELKITKNRNNKYTDNDNYYHNFKITTNKFWPLPRPTQSWAHHFQHKQTTTKYPVFNRFMTSTPNPDRSNLRFSKNRNVNIIVPRPTVKHEDQKTTKIKNRVILNQENTRNSFYGKHQQQNQYFIPQRQQNQHYQPNNYQQERHLQNTQNEQRNKMKAQEELRNKMKAQEELRNKIKAQEELRNKIKAQEELRNKIKAQEELRNKMKEQEDLRNKMKAREELRNKMKKQEDLRNKKLHSSLKDDDLETHQSWLWKQQQKSHNNFFNKNVKPDKPDNKHNHYFQKLNDKKHQGFLQSEDSQKKNVHRYKMQQPPTLTYDSNESDDMNSLEFGQKRKTIKNKFNDDDLKQNPKFNQKEYFVKQRQHNLDSKLNRTFEKRPKLKSTAYPTYDSENGVDYDKSPWKYEPKFSFEAQPVPDDVVPLPTATTSKTTTSTSTTKKPTTPTPPQKTTTTRPVERTPPPANDPDYVPIYRQELKDRCGILATPLIIGGQRSRTDQWPWQVSLQIVSSTTPWHRCGGVLVHPKWVLTAAHCMEGPFYGDVSNWRVVMADYDLEYVSGNEIYRDIVRVISHPGYVRTSNYPNDVALLELNYPLDITSGEVQTACLPDSDFSLTPGTQCWISGWGETRGTGGQENTMNEVMVDVLQHDECKSMWGRVNIDVLDSQVCLGYGLTGACYGDSGGPLMCESEGRFYVAGVMSWLINNCSATNFPNVFTRLPNYMDWLYQELDHYEWFQYT